MLQPGMAAALGCAGALVWIAGCAVRQEATADLVEALRRHEQRVEEEPAAYTLPVPEPSRREPSVPSVDETPGSAPGDTQRNARSLLAGYIRQALRSNPGIQAAVERARAAAERVPQATSLSDPLLSMKILPEPVRTAEGDNFFVLAVQQRFPVPEKLDRAGRIALQEMRMALAALDEQRLRVIAGVKRAYFRLYVIDRTIELTEANRDLLRGLVDAVRAEVAAGRRGQDDVLRAQVELSRLESELVELRQRRISAAADLNRWCNRPPDAPVPVAAALPLRSVEARLETLLAKTLEASPALARLREQIERDRQRVHLARLAWWPDFAVGFEWISMRPRSAFQPPPNPQTGIRPVVSRMSEEGSDNWAITVGVTLPIWWDRIQAGIREAHQALLASQQEYADARNRIFSAVQDALARARAQEELARIFRDTIVPQARQAYEVSRAAYTGGRSDFLFVIDNWRKWLEFSIQYHAAVGATESSLADLEEAIGMAVTQMEAAP